MSPHLRSFVGRLSTRGLTSEMLSYQTMTNRREIEDWQLTQIDRQWKRAIAVVPFWREWQRENDLPTTVQSWQAYSRFPVVTKSDMRRLQTFVERTPGTTRWDLTGGTSGTPFRFPASSADSVVRKRNVGVLRSWSGIQPGDRYVHVWGHAHLYGGGLYGQLRRHERHAKDRIMGATRLDAYDQSETAARSYLGVVESSHPNFLIGYTSSIVRMALVALEDGNFRPPKSLRCVVVTGETAPPEDIHTIEQAFQVPCHIEYGCAEVGVIAGSRDSSHRLSTLWRSVALNDSAKGSVISSLWDKTFPLFRYELGDQLSSRDSVDANGSILRVESVTGRAQEVLQFRSAVSGVIPVRASSVLEVLRGHRGVEGVQAVQLGAGTVGVLVIGVGSEEALADLRQLVLVGLGKSVGALDPASLVMATASSHILSRSGKRKFLVNASDLGETNPFFERGAGSL